MINSISKVTFPTLAIPFASFFSESVHIYHLWPTVFFYRTCRCFLQTAQCSTQSCLQSRVLVVNFTTLLASPPRLVSSRFLFITIEMFHQKKHLRNNKCSRVWFVYNVLLLLPRQFVCICFPQITLLPLLSNESFHSFPHFPDGVRFKQGKEFIFVHFSKSNHTSSAAVKNA